MGKVFEEPKSYIQRVLMRSISRMNSSNWVEVNSGNSLTPFAVGDTINAIKFDTSVSTETVNAFLESLTYTDGICNLLSTTNGESETGILIVVNMEGSYMLAVNSGNTPTIVYDTNNGWVGEDTVTIPEYTISVVNEIAGWNGIIAGNASELTTAGVSLTAFSVGDNVYAIKFDTSKEAELLAFLQSLDYGSEGQVNLISFDNGTNESGAPLTGVVLMAATFGETYMLMSANGDMPTPIYSTGDFAMDTIVIVPGWQNLDENNVWKLDGQYTISEITNSESWNGVLAGNATESADSGVSLTAFEVGDVATQYVFDTTKGTELEAYLAELFAANPETNEIDLMSMCDEEGHPIKATLMALKAEGNIYVLAVVDGDADDSFVFVYSNADYEEAGIIEGFQNLTDGRYTPNNQYDIGVIEDEFVPINGVIVGK